MFNRKKGDPMQPAGPNQMINDMRSMGMSNNQIAQNMQRDGYNLGQINDAMNQVNMGAVNPPGPFPGQMPSQMPSQMPPMGGMGGPTMGSMPSMGQEYDESSLSNAQFEEVAESIIEEKWKDLMKNVNKIVEWKTQMDGRLVQMEQKFSDLQHNFDELHKALISKINEYDQNILNVGSQVKAMEKVFSKVLPTFTDTVSELGRITNYVKSGSKPQKKARDEDDDIDIPHDLLHNL